MLLNLPNAVTLKIVPQVVVTANHKMILFLLHNCKFATVVDCKCLIRRRSNMLSPKEWWPTG